MEGSSKERKKEEGYNKQLGRAGGRKNGRERGKEGSFQVIHGEIHEDVLR